MKDYFAIVNGCGVILHCQSSKIGYCYPNIFINVDNVHYVNVDCTIPTMFNMTKADFDSWLDGTEIYLSTDEMYHQFREYGLDVYSVLFILDSLKKVVQREAQKANS